MKNKDTTVELRGEHELYSAARLRPRLERLLAEGQSVVIDLREATFVDSATVNVLIEAKRRADQLGLRFSVIVGAETGPSVRRLFALTSLHDVLPITDEAPA
jgi:anti-anti-sigma factor